MTYADRAGMVNNPTAERLFRLMEKKRTNLCLALDVTTSKEFFSIAERIGPEICILKTHIDTMKDFSPDVIRKMQQLAEEHNFLLFEDRKFADIGHTVKLQYSAGIYHIADWADIINAHILPGKGIIEGLREAGLPKGRGLLLLAEMSSEGSLAVGEYTKTAYAWATEYDDFVIGFIGQGDRNRIPEAMIVMAPGVNLVQKGDALGQQYRTPSQAIASGADVLIVGRGIYHADDPAAVAAEYRRAGWKAYIERES